MLRALWYLVQMIVLLAGFGWLLAQGGQFDLHLGAYRLQGETPVLLIVLVVVLLILFAAHRVWLWFAHFPRTWTRYRRDIRLTKGHQALTRALSALAVGDHGIAHDQALRARRLLPEFGALPTLLIATTAEKTGRHDEAHKALVALLETDARDMGIRGLVQAALADGDWPRGLQMARDALARSPRTPMLQRLVYDLECQNGEFAQALKHQPALVRCGAISREFAKRDEAMLRVGLCREDQASGNSKQALRQARAAFAADPSFVPAACALVDLYRGFGKTRTAIRVLMACFALSPHPDLIDRWEQMAPATGGARDLAKRMRFYERLLAVRPDSADAQLMLARAAMSESLWGEARAYLTMAEKLAPRVSVFKTVAAFAERQGDMVAAQDALKAATTALPDPVWYCRVTGQVFPRFEPLILPDHRFGSVSFGVRGAFPVLDEPASSEVSSSLLGVG